MLARSQARKAVSSITGVGPGVGPRMGVFGGLPSVGCRLSVPPKSGPTFNQPELDPKKGAQGSEFDDILRLSGSDFAFGAIPTRSAGPRRGLEHLGGGRRGEGAGPPAAVFCAVSPPPRPLPPLRPAPVLAPWELASPPCSLSVRTRERPGARIAADPARGSTTLRFSSSFHPGSDSRDLDPIRRIASGPWTTGSAARFGAGRSSKSEPCATGVPLGAKLH